jgi:hypothetical protein
MRIIRLIGLLHGILLIAMIGEVLMRSVSGSGRRRRSDKEGGGAIMLLLLGLALMIVGYIGVFFGKLIKSAISRQREFPGRRFRCAVHAQPRRHRRALKEDRRVRQRLADQKCPRQEVSQLLLREGVRHVYFKALSTHPPIEERIRRLDPSFDGKAEPHAVEETWGADFDQKRAELASGLAGAERLVSMSPAAFVAQTGLPTTEHLDFAREILNQLPPELVEGARDAYGARAVVFGMLLDPDKALRQTQLNYLAENAEPGVLRDLRRLGPKLRDLRPDYKIPLVDLCLPGLKRLSGNQYKTFRENIRNLSRADNRLSLFEFAMGRILMRHLDPHFFGIKRNVIRFKRLDPVIKESALALSMLAHASSRSDRESETFFKKAATGLGLPSETLEMLPKSECTLTAFEGARCPCFGGSTQKPEACAAIVLPPESTLKGRTLCVVADSWIVQRPCLSPKPRVCQ